jgi:hypothetical protein
MPQQSGRATPPRARPETLAMSEHGPSRHLTVPQNLVAVGAMRTLAILSARQIYGISALRRGATPLRNEACPTGKSVRFIRSVFT